MREREMELEREREREQLERERLREQQGRTGVRVTADRARRDAAAREMQQSAREHMEAAARLPAVERIGQEEQVATSPGALPLGPSPWGPPL